MISKKIFLCITSATLLNAPSLNAARRYHLVHDTRGEKAAVGGALGATAGAMLGAAIGEDSGSALCGAVVGGIAGTTLGAASGNRHDVVVYEDDYVPAYYANRPARSYERELGELRRQTRELERVNRTLKYDIERLDRENTTLHAQLKQADKDIIELTRNNKELSAYADSMETYCGNLEEKNKLLEQKITTLERRLHMMSQQTTKKTAAQEPLRGKSDTTKTSHMPKADQK